MCGKGADRDPNQQLKGSISYYSILCGEKCLQTFGKFNQREGRSRNHVGFLLLVNIDFNDHPPLSRIYFPLQFKAHLLIVSEVDHCPLTWSEWFNHPIRSSSGGGSLMRNRLPFYHKIVHHRVLLGGKCFLKPTKWGVRDEFGPCRVTTAPWPRVQTGMSRRSGG